MATKLFSRKQSGGMFSIYDAAVTTGEYFFVDSTQTTNGDDTTGHGKDPDSPFLTIDFAISQCANNKGDIIYVMPNHAEAGAAASPILDLDKIGISIIGLGRGTNQPTVTFNHGSADCDIDAANCLIENINFVAGIDDVLVCLDVNADDFTVRNCRFTGTAADKNFRVCVQDAGANVSDRITVEGCYALQLDTENTHFINFAAAQDGCIIRDNILIGDWGTMCIGGAGVITFAVITGNMIHNVATTVDSCIQLPNATTGICAYNMCGGGAAVANGIDAIAMTNGENYYQIHTADLSGLLDPPNA